MDDRTVNGLTALHITVYDALTIENKFDADVYQSTIRTLVLGGADLLAKTTALATDEDVAGGRAASYPMPAGMTPMDVARTCGSMTRRAEVAATLTAAIAQRAL